MSLRSPSGTNFLISGERPSVRLPSRIVPSCVSDPIGCAFPFRTSSTPAMNVVLTAPMPGVKIPSFPFGGALFPGFSMQLLDRRDLWAVKAATHAERPPKQTSNDERREGDLQIRSVQFPKRALTVQHGRGYRILNSSGEMRARRVEEGPIPTPRTRTNRGKSWSENFLQSLALLVLPRSPSAVGRLRAKMALFASRYGASVCRV